MSWLEHCKGALWIGIKLILSGYIFIIHAIFPFIAIPAWLNLTEIAEYLINENIKRNVK